MVCHDCGKETGLCLHTARNGEVVVLCETCRWSRRMARRHETNASYLHRPDVRAQLAELA